MLIQFEGKSLNQLKDLAKEIWSNDQAVKICEAYSTDDLEIAYLFIKDNVINAPLSHVEAKIFQVLWENEVI